MTRYIKKHGKKRAHSQTSLKTSKHQYPFWILEALAGGLLIIGYMLSLSPFHKKLAVAVFLAAWVLAGLGVAMKLWHEFSVNEKVATNTRPKPERPYIWVKAVVPKLENLNASENTPIVELIFENSANVPAWDVIPKAHAYIATSKLSEVPPLPAEKPLQTPTRGFFLPANREATHVIGSPKNADPELKHKIDRREVFMYVLGSVTYKDQSNDAARHTTHFCGLYMPESNNFEQTPFGNEPD
jgi:hypothetical protein